MEQRRTGKICVKDVRGKRVDRDKQKGSVNLKVKKSFWIFVWRKLFKD
jgi:hypothetical protein